MIDGETSILEIVDTAGQEEYKALRAQYYQKAEGFIAVYSITDRNSFQEVERLREDVLEERSAEHVPIILVANKCDMDSHRRVLTKEGEALAAAWSADGKGSVPFLESSAKDSTNITELFHQVVRQVRSERNGGIPPAPVPAQPTPEKAAPTADAPPAAAAAATTATAAPAVPAPAPAPAAAAAPAAVKKPKEKKDKDSKGGKGKGKGKKGKATKKGDSKFKCTVM